jgi:hypothetical protein
MNNMMVMNAEEVATSSGETPQENIQVFLRLRPLNQRELGEEQAVCAMCGGRKEDALSDLNQTKLHVERTHSML